MRRPTWTHPKTAALATGASVAFTVLVLASVIVPGVYGLVGHNVCRPTTVLSTETLFTPLALVNAPYGGNATVREPLPAPPGVPSWGEITIPNSSAGGLFSLDHWTLDRATTAWVLGAGPDERCTVPYQAVDVSRSNGTSLGFTTYLLDTAGLYSDVGEKTSFAEQFLPPDANSTLAGQTYLSVTFSNAYVAPASPEVVRTCGSATSGVAVATSQTINITVGFPYAEGVTEQVTLNAPASYQYTLAAGGVYSIARSTASGAGWAFAWSPCAPSGA